ncbi:prolipoprotein diacylglyceryl transferase family protein [Rhodococcus marinonascens]|uniref:prolipoprotein diacylglyceryl transferase family protein n=1 Tax=Rhodococcus marinonascens TaxID=38311 RepID=UPI000A047AA1|nr:prolipoprotein diacylglyceryl transferase family protein [Rhodococcus marinonascens]
MSEDKVSDAVSAVATDYLRSRSAGTTTAQAKPTNTSPVPQPPPVHDTADSATPGGGCAEALADIEPQGLAATYWGEAPPEGPAQDISIRFTGVRIDSDTPPDKRPRFEHTTLASDIPAGSGRFAVTGRVHGIPTGQWHVSASRIDPYASDRTDQQPQTSVITTGIAPLAHGPSVRLWTWPLLVGSGAVVAILIQALLLARTDVNPAAAVSISIVGCLLGYVGAKVWYLVLHRQHPRNFVHAGACIQGFLLVALSVLVAGGALMGLGAGTLLDATTPGLFLGMAIGRPGCFLTGCCSGRPTVSRWGLWSSDRRVAVTRIPVQLIEAVAALIIGSATLAMALTLDLPVAGTLFVGATATYTLVRQWLFPFRADPHTRRGRHTTIATCIAIIAADVALIALG